MEQFYEGAESLFVRAYDAFYAGGAQPIAGDIAFYDRLAQATGGPPIAIANPCPRELASISAPFFCHLLLRQLRQCAVEEK